MKYIIPAAMVFLLIGVLITFVNGIDFENRPGYLDTIFCVSFGLFFIDFSIRTIQFIKEGIAKRRAKKKQS